MTAEVEKRLTKPTDQAYSREEILQALETNEEDFIEHSLNNKTRERKELVLWADKGHAQNDV